MLGKDKASDIIGNYNYNEWYIGGHSLGGYVATTYANEHRSEVTGVILLAAFAMDDMSDSSLKILSIYGDKDGILSMEKVENGRELMPSTYEEVVIEGGNHSQMGSYGFQKDDNRAYRSFEMGAKGGDPICATAQAIMLLKGMGVQKDEKAALPLILEAANRGVPGGAGAIILMAYVQYKGLGGIPADAYRAKQTLQDAVANNIPEALVYLAYITAKGGTNLTADEKESAMYLRMAKQDMKDEAQKLYDDLMKNGWDPEL